MVAKTAFGQRGVDLVLMADQKNGGDVFVVLQRLFDAGNDNAAAVVAAHDIHCNSHGEKSNTQHRTSNIQHPIQLRTTGCPVLNVGCWMLDVHQNQAPAVTLKTWRPL
jgi:hypothetical protein